MTERTAILPGGNGITHGPAHGVPCPLPSELSQTESSSDARERGSTFFCCGGPHLGLSSEATHL